MGSKEKSQTASPQEAPVKKTEKSLPEKDANIGQNIRQPAGNKVLPKDPIVPNVSKPPKKLTRKEQASHDFIGTNDKVEFSGDVGYAKGGKAYTVGMIRKDGSFELSSPTGSTVISSSEVKRAISQGVTVSEAGATKLSEIALPDTTKTVEVDGVEYEVNQTADEAISDIDKRLGALHELKACLNG